MNNKTTKTFIQLVNHHRKLRAHSLQLTETAEKIIYRAQLIRDQADRLRSYIDDILDNKKSLE